MSWHAGNNIFHQRNLGNKEVNTQDIYSQIQLPFLFLECNIIVLFFVPSLIFYSTFCLSPRCLGITLTAMLAKRIVMISTHFLVLISKHLLVQDSSGYHEPVRIRCTERLPATTHHAKCSTRVRKYARYGQTSHR